MRNKVKQFVAVCAGTLPLTEPIYEFGSLQVEGQEGFADLRPYFPNKKYVGADFRLGLGVDIILNLEKIDLPDESVGTVLMMDTLEHVQNPILAMQEVHRILKPNGVVIMSSVMNFPIHDYPYDYWRFTPECFNFLMQKYNAVYVSYIGKKEFPHTILGVGYKGTGIAEMQNHMEKLKNIHYYAEQFNLYVSFVRIVKKMLPLKLFKFIQKLIK